MGPARPFLPQGYSLLGGVPGAGAGGVAAGVERPTRGRAGHPLSPYLALLQAGFDRRYVAIRGRALLPPDFTLAAGCRRRYVSVPLSVAAAPGLRHRGDSAGRRSDAWELPSALSGGARTFLPAATAGIL